MDNETLRRRAKVFASQIKRDDIYRYGSSVRNYVNDEDALLDSVSYLGGADVEEWLDLVYVYITEAFERLQDEYRCDARAELIGVFEEGQRDAVVRAIEVMLRFRTDHE